MSRHLGDRVIGICDSPVGLGRRIARVLGADPDRAWIDYAGLNHLGWVRGLYVDGRDELPRLLADPKLLDSFEEGRLFGAELLRSLGAIPNEYLHYYYFNREAVRAYQEAEQTRGAFLRDQQEGFYARMREPGTPALATWDRTRAEREATYMAENREVAGAGEREESDLESGGYEQVALALMRAVARNERTSLILNVRNRTALSALDADAVVEVPCLVDANGAHPVAVSPAEPRGRPRHRREGRGAGGAGGGGERVPRGGRPGVRAAPAGRLRDRGPAAARPVRRSPSGARLPRPALTPWGSRGNGTGPT